MKSLKKILSLAISLSFLWQQLGFAQVAAMDLGKYLTPKALMAEKFRPMHMRYFSYDGQNQSFDFLLDKGNIKNVKGPAAKEQANAIFKYFLIGISLPNEAFWVNLRPDSEDQIIDPELAKTDMGKVLLEADLQLKKDTAVFTSPNNAKGREYWNRLYKKAGELFGQEDVTIPTLTRPWIVPGEVIVRYTGTSAYVYKSALKVMLEQDHLKNSVQYNFSDPRLKALNEYSSQLIRELIIPELNKQINTAKKYAELRQVFYSLVLAQCFKLKFSHNGGSYAQRIDSRNLSGLISTNNWSKTTYYKEYQQSFKDGEYNIKEPIRTPFGQTMRSYFSGGFQGAVSPAAFVPGNPANPVAAVAADGSVAMRVEGGQVKIPAPEGPVDSAGYEGRPNDDYNADLNPAIRPGYLNQFSRKFTVPYAPDNALFRTKEGRAKAAEYADQVLQEVEKRALTVVFGKEFAKGKQVIARTSTDANMGWTDLVREEHPDGLKFLLAQARLTQKGIPALMAGNYATYIECLRDYSDSRSNASKTWLRLILAARRGEKGLPQWVYNRWKVLEENKTKYETFFNLFEEFDKHAGDNTEYGNPDEYDLYAPGEIGKAVIAARKFSIRTSRPVAVFALGAGGFGSVCALVGVDQATAIEFANELGLPQMIDPDKQETKNPLANNSITVEEAEKDTKDGILRFWRAAKADREGGVLADGKADWSLGLAEWNEEVKRLTNGVTLQIDHELPWVLVNKDTLEVKQLDEVIDEQGAVKAEYPATEWLVLKNWDVDFDWKTYFRPDMLLISPKNKELVAERQKVEPGQKTLLEVFPQLLSWARANGKKIIFSAPVRWLDTLGSSWDLVDFRLMGTPEGDMCLELLPACNAIPSEYRVELTITPTDNPNTIEYKSAAFFGNLPDHTYSMDPSKVVRLDREAKEGEYEDSIILVPHPEKPGLMMLQRKERDLPAYFANLFGIKGGLRLELSQMSFVPRQGGMESSNIFTDLACLIMATLSGAKFSVAEISHISLMAQINECNNITGNQGADAAWAGAGLHYYLGGIKDSKSQRDFAAVAVDSGKAKQVPLPYWISHPAWGVNHSNVTNTVPHAIMLDQQAIKLNPEQLGVLDAAVEMLPSNVRELVSRNTLIFLNFTDNKTGHRSLGRDQIEIDTALLDKGRKNDLALRLWHEAVERQAIIDVLKDLGLIEAFNKTLLSPKERETTFVDIGGYQVVLSEVINNISAVVHQALETSQISGQYLRWPLAILKEGGKASDLSFISFNLVAFLTKRAVMDKVAYFRNINISKNDHERAAMRIYFMQVALKGTNISSGIVTMDLSDINEAFKPANNLMDIIAIGGLVVPENWPVGGTPEQARTAAGPANAPGGIDFRYIGIMTQFQKGDFKHSFEMPDLASLKAMDLVMEKQKLMQMISSGIQPSGKRVAEYVSACYVKNGAKQGLADAMACLTSLFKMEEENVIETDPELKSFLFFMESSDLS